MSPTSETLHVVCPNCAGVNRVPAARLGEGPACARCHEKLFQGRAVALGAANFSTHVERSDLPVVVDCWAPWCAPCRAMAPVFEAAAAELEPALRFAKLNTEDEPSLAQALQIRSIPTLLVFRQGRELARQSGALTGAQLRGWLRQVLG